MGKITEENIGDAVREIRIALLEADVNYQVVKEFVSDVKAKALDAEVSKSLKPDEVFLKIVKDELVSLLIFSLAISLSTSLETFSAFSSLFIRIYEVPPIARRSAINLIGPFFIFFLFFISITIKIIS